MLQWIGEASGNRFLVCIEDGSHSNGSFTLLERIRNQRAWTFDSGLILVRSDSHHVWRMHVVEHDGSVSEMCGNGARLAGMVVSLGKKIQIETAYGCVDVESFGSYSRAVMSIPVFEEERTFSLQPGITYCGQHIRVHGEPHIVVNVPNVWNFPIEHLGLQVVPQANLTIVSGYGRRIDARTFERGVNRETQSCGTGACAAALVAGSRVTRVAMHNHELLVSCEKDAVVLEGSGSFERTNGERDF
ncbi:MAG: Diaminopimelate epimerase [Parcubacteria group bacterium GW2011_GWA2_43_13]|nr:MAG: Diaminopimelate epimerase [Parcubacteria group bacterium GW2011_GWA2_43_13]OGY70307.1 MAG: hypothetical protein A2986_04565 [Candidatus Jacksonbacteria bacterium RIFCSPLOWO2_01_FULL_44_13]HAZ16922.1 hypothetical protein [Candidatus Jacksonbacteria bacterium]